MPSRRLILFCLVLLLCFATQGLAEPRLRPQDWATPVISQNLHNWHQVDRRLYRSEQPDAEAMREISSAGITRVLNLREFHSDEEEAAGTGLTLYRVPINTFAFGDAEILAALRIILASDEPILLHCWHGADRTGAVSAIYRIVVQGWTRQEALDELMNGGFGYHSLFGNIPDYIRNVDIEYLREELHLPHTHN